MRHVLPVLLAFPVQLGCIEYGIKGFGTAGGAPIEEVLGEPETQSDIWEAVGTDVIFFGDTSDSMTQELETMGDHALSFMDGLDDFDNDWQIIAVTGWDGCGVNGIISPSVDNYDRLFAEALVTAPDADAVAAGADEWGLYNAEMAVQAASDGGCNEGFLRDDALLHVIFLSDEPDSSPGWEDGDSSYWKEYVDNISSSKAGDYLVTFSAVVGPEPDGCDGAAAGEGYTAAVESTGGSLLSICEDWYNQLHELVLASVQVSDFPLSRRPDVDTLRVVVSGSERTDGWEYQDTGNLVHFTEDLPTISQKVSISYEVAE